MTVVNHEPADRIDTPARHESRGPVISVRNLHKTFRRRAGGGEVKPVNDVSLDVHLGELVVLLGPSGCGKTTLLRCVAGLERPDAGEISIDGTVVFSSAQGIFLPPNRRRLSMIFQSYALWPHMSVDANVGYPLTCAPKKMRRQEIRQKVERVLEVTGLGGLGAQYPGQLSGGQQQRVALARALVADPDVVLFDEPLSNVDAQVREQLRVELLSMQRQLGFAALYVTHDQTEAMELAHRIAVLREGEIAQIDRPRTVYHSPRSLYVASFIGTTNIVEGEVRSLSGDVAEVATDAGAVRVDSSGVAEPVRAQFEREGSAPCVLVFRPEAVELRPAEGEPTDRTWRGEISAEMFVGSHVEYLLQIGSARVRSWSSREQGFQEGDLVEFELPSDAVLALPPGDQQ